MKDTMIKLLLLFFTIQLNTSADNSSTNVKIKTNPEGYHIFVSGEYAGKSNLSMNLEAGKYVIKIADSKFGWNSTEITDTVTIKSGQPELSLEYSLEKNILIRTIPQDTYVYQSDSLIAHTPTSLPKSLGELKLWKPKYEPKFINTGNFTQSPVIELNFLGKQENEEKFVDSPWFIVVLSSAALFGATAAYFKIQADQKYDDYLISRDADLLDEVDKYDLYSGIAFGILQVNFGILIYNFLFENPTD